MINVTLLIGRSQHIFWAESQNSRQKAEEI